MLVRVGLPKTTGALPGACFDMEAPALVSANCMWDPKRKQFREPGWAIGDLDVALDSAGFVAMSTYGGYPWTVAQYTELAGLMGWTWWAQMDFCCEPEIAHDHAEVDKRMWATLVLLAQTMLQVEAYWEMGYPWIQYPMPVLQGWTIDDYMQSAAWVDELLHKHTFTKAWPDLVGVGSVCRREHDDILAIVAALDEVLPPHVKLHLFGVKGSAIRELAGWDRVESTDSASWAMTARKEARARRVPCDIALKIETMRAWYDSIASSPVQTGLFTPQPRRRDT